MSKEEQMKKEYDKGGKFADFVNKGCEMYKTDVLTELKKATVYEYYLSVTEGVNKG